MALQDIIELITQLNVAQSKENSRGFNREIRLVWVLNDMVEHFQR